MSSIISTRDLPQSLLSAARLVGYTPHLASTYDARVSYALYIPPSHYTNDASLPVVVAVHGTTRQTTPLLSAFQEVADTCRCAILAPLFPAGLNGPNDWDNYRVLRPSKQDAWLGDTQADTALLNILDTDVPARWPGLDTGKVVLAGFSGGASMVQRFCLLYSERVIAASIAAPGSTTKLRTSQEWPEGTADMADIFDGRATGDLTSIAAWQLVVGSDDTALEGSLESIVAAAQGWQERKDEVDWEQLLRSRMVSRRELLETFADDLAKEGVKKPSVEIVPGGKHALKDVAPAMAQFLKDVIGDIAR
ncbi:uncharacterized protein JN550_001692 [Neoarthrinium moseri]|uniref:uncharacterized protein n=1 Tax=Neoarthrinium moseri TaxID=1658444 RepID=UPI001FDD2FA1|nr:uncharacterized protein JN550_001692 [Neoarthrinium moseri]KAI1876196.1 hypothetical protein JN550_001692 [Neoarthrinium moseri]